MGLLPVRIAHISRSKERVSSLTVQGWVIWGCWLVRWFVNSYNYLPN